LFSNFDEDMRALLMVLMLLVLSASCSKQKYGQCGAPNEDLKILFKPKNPIHPFSHSFCIVCNPELEPSEYYDWAVSMGANETNPLNPEAPCLYVYHCENVEGVDCPEGLDTNDTFAGCKSLVCDGGAAYGDMVSPKNGNINLDPILNGDQIVEEEWLLLEEGQALMGMPPSHSNESAPISITY